MKTKLLTVKPFRQSPDHCGPAALKMVLDYYGIQKTEQELAKLCNTTREYGTRRRKIKQAVERLGLRGYTTCYASLAQLERFYERKIPVIVNWFSVDDGHYSVVVGIDEKKVYLADPEIGRVRAMDRNIFKRVWFDFRGDYITSPQKLRIRPIIVVYPPRGGKLSKK